MDEIPSVSFKDGQIVIVNKDQYEILRIDKKEADLSRLMVSLEDYDKLYLVDLDGIEINRPQLELIHKLSTRREVWADCGVSDINTVLDLYVSGADRVVISTKTMDDLSLMEEAVNISDSMIFSIDIFEGKVLSPVEDVKKEGLFDILERAVEVGFDLIVISNLGDDTLDLSELRNSPEGEYEIYVSGKVDINRKLEEIINGKILDLKEVLGFHRTS